MTLAERIESLFEQSTLTSEHEAAFAELLDALNAGSVRAAEPERGVAHRMARQRLG